MQHGAQSVPGAPSLGLGYGVRPLADSFVTLAEALQEAGYRTGGVIGGPALRRELGVAQGFEIYRDALDTPARRRIGKRAQTVADEALAILAEFGEGPFFLFVNFFDPHAPYRPPPPHARGLPPPQTEKELVAFWDRLERGEPARPVDALPPSEREALEAMRAGYRAEIRYMDEHLGRVLDALPPGTLVVVTGDHGESFGEHYLLRHGAHLYEDNVRVPLLVREPGQKRGRRVPAPVQNHWVVSRLLAASGASLPAPVRLPPLEPGAAPIVLQVQRSESNIRLLGRSLDRDLLGYVDPPLKLIESSTGRIELYDLDADPGELRDLAALESPAASRLRDGLEGVASEYAPLYDVDERAELGEDTEQALKALGYLE